MEPTLNIDVCFEPICPWCLIGKRRLSRAPAGARPPTTPPSAMREALSTDGGIGEK